MQASSITTKEFEQRVAREYSKSLFSDFDTHFLVIWLIAIVVEIILVTFMARRPVEEFTAQEIAVIQERFANFVLGESAVRDEPVMGIPTGTGTETGEETGVTETVEETDPGVGDGTSEGSGGTGDGADTRQMRRVSTQEAIRQSRERISEEVSNKGILGLLTGTGTSAEGQAVSGLFNQSSGGAGGDLDDVLASVEGLQSSGSGGAGSGGSGGVGSAKGGRSNRKAGIDDLVTDLESASSQSFSRKGEIMVEAPSELVGRGSRSAYRSPDAIQEVLISHNAAIRYCYERELKRNPGLKGKVSVRITVGADGHVTNAEIVESTLNNSRVERCILARIRLWKDFHPIDNAEGEVTFRQIYAFGY